MTTIAVLGGDGIGPEVTAAAVRVLGTVLPSLEVVTGHAGRGPLAEHGTVIAPDTVELLAEGGVDGVLFGASETRPGEPSAVLALRQLAGARCNVRPARTRLPGGPACDVIVYRELTEDLYIQEEEVDEDGVAFALRRISEDATCRFAELALEHAPTDVPLVVANKATVLPTTDGLFVRVVAEVAAKRGRTVRPRLVDSLAHDLVRDPSGPLGVLAPNVYGDILSDVTAALAGGLGLAPSLTLGDGALLAEPVHGTAPDIAGTGRANPAAAMLSGALLVGALGHTREARALEEAIDAALADPSAATPDVGGRGSTDTFTAAVERLLEATP